MARLRSSKLSGCFACKGGEQMTVRRVATCISRDLLNPTWFRQWRRTLCSSHVIELAAELLKAETT